MLTDLRIMYESLTMPEPPLRDLPKAVPVRDTDGTLILDEQGNPLLRQHWDPVGYATPAAPIRPGSSATKIDAHPRSTPPVDLTAVDLLGPVRPGAVEGPDQYGDLSVATELASWASRWRQHRAVGEIEPKATVDGLTRWLVERCEDACDTDASIGGFAVDIRRLVGVLRRVLGLADRPDYKQGVACPRCGTRALWQRNGSSWIECAACPVVLSDMEYADTVAQQVRHAEKVTVAWLARQGLTALH